MSNTANPRTDRDEHTLYQIRIKGHLGKQWTEWFGGMAIASEDNGDTLLSGPVVDQAALFGLLTRVRDLGMPLLSVNRLESDQAVASDVGQQTGAGYQKAARQSRTKEADDE
jgi:hypothetical protein